MISTVFQVDSFSFGSFIFELLTQELPFQKYGTSQADQFIAEKKRPKLKSGVSDHVNILRPAIWHYHQAQILQSQLLCLMLVSSGLSRGLCQIWRKIRKTLSQIFLLLYSNDSCTYCFNIVFKRLLRWFEEILLSLMMII